MVLFFWRPLNKVGQDKLHLIRYRPEGWIGAVVAFPQIHLNPDILVARCISVHLLRERTLSSLGTLAALLWDPYVSLTSQTNAKHLQNWSLTRTWPWSENDGGSRQLKQSSREQGPSLSLKLQCSEPQPRKNGKWEPQDTIWESPGRKRERNSRRSKTHVGLMRPHNPESQSLVRFLTCMWVALVIKRKKWTTALIHTHKSDSI